MYIIKRRDQRGVYLGRNPGDIGDTWTRKLEEARIFATKTEAEDNCCPENETVCRLTSLLKGL